ncbi:uncharacterized protein LTR77_002345 [Saxophila tyrrhenica]|uniref:Prion-inhibition and propagation HeLo domain-containing protein n=1 Tax=Saxophila tyrrhenica TaxID=1690608 RepID=A0AAV9PJ80_9PEZI|nr:hypothetical protein LTR77_002345 [Saxophila tyrrhenica]
MPEAADLTFSANKDGVVDSLSWLQKTTKNEPGNPTAAGLALSILSVFNVVLEDIHLLHAIKEFDTSYHTSALQLANAQLRLSRWGEALGLTKAEVDEIDNRVDHTTLNKLMPEKDRKAAYENLEKIKVLLAEAHDKAQKYETSPATEHDRVHKSRSLPKLLEHRSGSTATSVAAPDLVVEGLSEGVRQLSINRKAPLMTKMKRALYEKPIFRELLNDITEIMTAVETLFPQCQQARSTLAREEVRILGIEGVEKMLSTLVEKAAQDEVLKDAIKMEHPAPATTTNHSGAYNKGFQSGTVNGGTFSQGG